MSDSRPRRLKHAPPGGAGSLGYRSSKRGSKAVKKAERAEKAFEVGATVRRAGKTVSDIGYLLAQGLAAFVALLLALLLVATAINGIARWNAKRALSHAGTRAELERRSKENLLIIGADGKKAAGFLAIRADKKGNQVFGIAIPEGAFIEVPGQGFERIGDSFTAGADVSLSAVSNFLSVPFHNYVIVPAAVYKDALKSQAVSGVMEARTSTNLSGSDLDAMSNDLEAIPQKNVALVPLPVKPIKAGNQTYFEPQRDQIADLLKSWWGVDAKQTQELTRVIVYNGAGKPGLAGEAAQQLIRAGFRVVDTKNADNFTHTTTQIVVQQGDKSRGEEAARVLGVGTVIVEPSDQDVTDLIIVIGKDYTPPAGGTSGGNQ